MPGKNLKITTKLTICTAIFLLPLGIMLSSILSVSLNYIRKDQVALQGLDDLRPAMSLMQILPQYVKVSVDAMPGDREHIRSLAANLIMEFEQKISENFGRETHVIEPRALSQNWDILSGGGTQQQVIQAYMQFTEDLRAMITYIGDVSGLVTDSELENAHLAAVTIHDLPLAQERVISISNVLRSMENGILTGDQRNDLERNLVLLNYYDNLRIQDRFNALEVRSEHNRETELQHVFRTLINHCYDAIAVFARSVEFAMNAPVIERQMLIACLNAASFANDNAFRLQNASLEQLGTLIHGRIQANQGYLVRSLVFAAAATIAAFAIIFITIVHIHRAAKAVNHVFKHLEKNDLAVQVPALPQDELGEVMDALGSFLGKLESSFVLFSQNAAIISTAVNDLSASAKEITTTANEQSASVAEIVSTMESNKDLSGQVAAKTLEVAQLATKTKDLSQYGADLHDANEDMMLDIRNQNVKIVEEISNLSDVLSRIDESVQLIDKIADQTKLIAFNAALEASSSGEAGLRFAVVAGEIRRFADNVVVSVSEIKERILELQNASETLISEAAIGSQVIDSGHNRMVEQKDAFKNIVDVSHDVAARSHQISSLSKQQELSAEQIFFALKEISEGVKHFVTATSSTSTTADKLNRMSIEFRETLEKYRTAEAGETS